MASAGSRAKVGVFPQGTFELWVVPSPRRALALRYRPPNSYGLYHISREYQTGASLRSLPRKGDRLSRNPVDSATLIELLDQGKVEEIITCDKTYRRHSMDKFMLYLEFALADQYITKLREDVTRGNRTMLESGLWPGRRRDVQQRGVREREAAPGP